MIFNKDTLVLEVNKFVLGKDSQTFHQENIKRRNLFNIVIHIIKIHVIIFSLTLDTFLTVKKKKHRNRVTIQTIVITQIFITFLYLCQLSSFAFYFRL